MPGELKKCIVITRRIETSQNQIFLSVSELMFSKNLSFVACEGMLSTVKNKVGFYEKLASVVREHDFLMISYYSDLSRRLPK